ncbi:MAG: M20/M25/M40 family metallo-hydrolase [Euryarchaeota archaeon]|nr:M20/M25/M40 family metallo-hydrolase [Euryarchaeota archaeon]
MKKIACLVICTLMIVTVFPVVGFPIQKEEIKNLNNAQPHYKAPTPGYAPIPPSDTLIDVPTVREHPEKTAATMDDTVISMIEQVDVSIYLRYLDNLTALGPRPTGSSACVASAAYIYNQFESMGLAVRYHNWNSAGYSSANIEATINGTDESSDEIYIICAHYDTVSAGPGADDDTSGTVAVIMAALIMSQHQFKFNHTIKFVAFSGEEQGLLGSGVYAADAAAEGWDIAGVLNADMISYAITTNDGNNLIVFEDTDSEWLYTYTLDINTEYADYTHLTLHHGSYTWGSDHNSFWDEGYDALFYFEYTETPYYHTSGDTIAHINKTYAVKNIRLILATLAELSEVRFLSNPPAAPVLTGPTSGVINQAYTLSVVTTEPDGEDVYYFIEWGDSQADEWVGPYNSGVTAEITHQWDKKGTYTIMAKAKDIYGMESGWGTINVVMPTEYTFSFNVFLQHLFERFPHMFPILRHLIGY